MQQSKNLRQIKGVGEAKAVQLLAAAEIGKRLYQKHSEGRYTIRSPEDAAAYLMTDMSSLKPGTFRRFIFKCEK